MRNTAALAEGPFDVLVVGGGIHGACLAWAASRRGLRVALVEQGDYGQGTSANSQKVIHGGLRYLQSLDFARMRESIRARSQLLAFAPHLVVPRPFLMPTRGCGLYSRAALAAALGMNALISADRNAGLPPSHRLPAGGLLSRSECLARIPGLDPAGVTGGALWYDAVAQDTERLTLEFVLCAREAGAVLCNYTRAERLLRRSGRVEGAVVCDLISGAQLDVRAALTLFAGGPWLAQLAPELARADALPQRWVRGYTLTVRRPLGGEAGVALEGPVASAEPNAVLSRARRNLFLVPWRGGTMIGTWYEPYRGNPDACALAPEEISRAVAEVNAVYPGWGLRAEEVSMACVGLIPASGRDGAGSDKRTRLLGPWNGGPPGFAAVQGVKYTTALVLAERVLDRLWPGATPGAPRRSRAAGAQPFEEPVTSAEVTDWTRSQSLALPPGAAAGLALRHGPRFRSVLKTAGEMPGGLALVVPEGDVITGEIRHAVLAEQACSLADVVLRRTGLGTADVPSRACLQACVAIAGPLLNWAPERGTAEMDACIEHYRRHGLAGVIPG